ncbi:MBP isoform 28 [Pongo abelii]|uniref:Myelin basic protein n=1 Tax=Pongo abelii TaxID=9601 RepID=A0A2J8T7L2_PONAB|nr:MBP isoform 20 [Pongo abelii]PNJ29029.1 MBP isoform 28 [Pongo abelii]
MASQKRPSQRHGSKYLATASTMDHARHGFLPRTHTMQQELLTTAPCPRSHTAGPKMKTP